MMSGIFRNVRKELLKPSMEPKQKFSSATSGSSGSSWSASSKSKPELTQNEQRIFTTLKVMAVFLPGVYIGHVMSDHGFFRSLENGKDEKNGDKDSKENNGKDKEKKDKEK